MFNYVPVKTLAYLEAESDGRLQMALVDTGGSSSENSSQLA